MRGRHLYREERARHADAVPHIRQAMAVETRARRGFPSPIPGPGVVPAWPPPHCGTLRRIQTTHGTLQRATRVLVAAFISLAAPCLRGVAAACDQATVYAAYSSQAAGVALLLTGTPCQPRPLC
jgi:hypothetical protein